ncbi:P-loop containing nucleoside triphosphate hydrolase protein [Chytridium lagenaria]|nr:P-loop containing nucleoside triphosphate hydrolase protein [Chytridium lagenaria]
MTTHQVELESKPQSLQMRWNNELSWNNISYEIPIGRKGTRQLLKNVNGSIKSGQMLAILGSSGAGKTTLLNCLSGRLATGTLGGSILYNGKLRNPRVWRKTMAFVEQQDVLYSQLTVRETLRYAARLRLPSSEYTNEEKNRRSEEVLKSLRLTKAADTRIGDDVVRGVSGGEKKRVAIGQELVGDPEILVLDEPTSVTEISLQVLTPTAPYPYRKRKNDALATGRIVIATVHQPSFDLLAFSTTSSSSLAVPLPNQNPADFFMDLLTIDSSKPDDEMKKDILRVEALQRRGAKGKGVLPVVSLDAIATTEEMMEKEAKEAANRLGGQNHDAVVRMEWANPWLQEIGILCGRSWLQVRRGRDVILANLARTIIQALLIGFTFYRLKNDQRSIQNRLGVLFFVTIFNIITMILLVFPMERVILLRERAARSYRVSSFYIAKFITEAATSTFFSALGHVSIYLIVGLRIDSPVFIFRFLLALWVEVLVCVAVGFLIGAAVPFQLAQIIGPLVGVVFLLYAGSLVNSDDLPVVFKGFQYISPANYAYRAIMINEFEGLKLECSENPNLPCFSQGQQRNQN